MANDREMELFWDSAPMPNTEAIELQKRILAGELIPEIDTALKTFNAYRDHLLKVNAVAPADVAQIAALLTIASMLSELR